MGRGYSFSRYKSLIAVIDYEGTSTATRNWNNDDTKGSGMHVQLCGESVIDAFAGD